MKKVLMATLMVALMMATAFHVNAVSVQKETTEDEEKENIIINHVSDSSGSIKRKEYSYCNIRTGRLGYAGSAFLFPGYIRSENRKIFVLLSSGIVFGISDGWGDSELYINGDLYGEPFLMFVKSYTGTLHHMWNPWYKIFFLDGGANYLVIYYR